MLPKPDYHCRVSGAPLIMMLLQYGMGLPISARALPDSTHVQIVVLCAHHWYVGLTKVS